MQIGSHLDVGEGAFVGLDEGPHETLVLDIIHQTWVRDRHHHTTLQQQRLLTDEVVYDGVVDVPPVVAAQQHLPLAVQEVDSAAGHRQPVCTCLETGRKI